MQLQQERWTHINVAISTKRPAEENKLRLTLFQWRKQTKVHVTFCFFVNTEMIMRNYFVDRPPPLCWVFLSFIPASTVSQQGWTGWCYRCIEDTVNKKKPAHDSFYRSLKTHYVRVTTALAFIAHCSDIRTYFRASTEQEQMQHGGRSSLITNLTFEHRQKARLLLLLVRDDQI